MNTTSTANSPLNSQPTIDQPNPDQPNLDLKRIFTALQEARTRLAAVDAAQHEPIAIVGMAGRFPGANNVQEFWENLQAGRSGIRELTDAELVTSGVSSEVWQQPNYVRAYASPDDIAGFDAELFGYAPREVELIDPQHRLFLECAWEALEHAGHDAAQFPGKIAVYGGASMNGYLINLHSDRQLRETTDPVQVVVSNALGLMPMRVAHKLNLTGASCGIQTGCSTSLVAVHLACQSLRSRESDMVLAGGASVGILQKQGYLYQPNSILSPDGKCRAFDAAANGTIFGNGVGMVVLKRLSDAIADGNMIYATIQATAVNNDGAQKVSLTAPSVTGQAEVIAAALQQARLEPTAVSYLETHGTGTPIGDPIEFAALQKVYGQSNQPYCAVGSVKTNVGHLDAAAGITGLIKTALMLHHQKLLPSLNFQTLNPQINVDRSPFYVNTRLQDWVSPEPTRYAALSSFGMGGTNVHAILASAPSPQDKTTSAAPLNSTQIIPISAKTPTALAILCRRLQDYLTQNPQIALADVTHTMQTGRKNLECRCAIVADNADQAIASLSEIQSHKVSEVLPIAFLFSGQGSQYMGMMQALYDSELIFREWLDRGFDYLQSTCNLDLKSVLYPTNEQADKNQLNQTQYSQPAIFLVEYALAQLLINWGIQPQAMLGHSIGEYVAATLAGVFSFETALQLVALRGRFMQECEPGIMLSVSQSVEFVKPLLPQNSYIAVINAPNLCVVSGNVDAIAQLENQLDRQNITHRRLQTSHAFHSPMMQAAATKLQQHLATITFNPPQQRWISNLTGTWIDDRQVMQAQYWIDHLLNPVKFSAGLTELQQTPHILVEVGPSTTLCSLAKHNGVTTPIVAINRHPQDQQSDRTALAKAIAQLWQQGLTINWQALHTSEQPHRIPLPTYPFEHQSYWIERQDDTASHALNTVENSTKTADPANWTYLPTWHRSPMLRSAQSNSLPETGTWQIYSLQDELVQQWQQRFADRDTNLDRFNPEQPCDCLLIDFGDGEISPDQILEFLQVIIKQQQPLRLELITHEAQAILGSERLNPHQAMLYGFTQVLTQEYPTITCRIIDIDRLSKHAIFTELAQSSVQAPSDRFTIVGYRHAQRWQQQFTSIQLPESSTPVIKPNHTYIIAGEMIDSLSLVYAQWLSQTSGVSLLLLGNADFPAMPEWETWLATHGAQDHISQWIQSLQELQISGVNLQFMPIDLTDKQTLTACITDHTAPIAGVIYTGTMGDRNSCLMPMLTPNVLSHQITQKITSLTNLEQALNDHTPDFFLIQSSLSTIVGGLGFAAYAAAHHYIDTIVEQRNQAALIDQSDTQWISIDWDAVQLYDATASEWFANAIPPEQVSQITDRVLGQNLTSQIIISPIDLVNRLRTAQTSEASPNSVSQHHRPQLSIAYIAPRNPIEQRIAELMAKLLGITQIGVEDSFFELGGHSLLAIQAVSQLREEFQVDIPMRQFLFESPTIAGIAKIIETHQVNTQLDLTEQLLEQIENSP
jgi:acyl transferase domain-containing protein/acyl carrier protein